MRLIKVRITNFQSIQDSTEFEIGDVTCVVGKNEAGKTALLKALYRLNPVIEGDGDFDATDDYPRRYVSDYEDDVEAGHTKPADVVRATYELDPEDIAAVEAAFGTGCLKNQSPCVALTKGYDNQRRFSGLEVDLDATLRHLIETAGLPRTLEEEAHDLDSAEQAIEVLRGAEQTSEVQQVSQVLQQIVEHDLSYVVYTSVLKSRIPKFLYFDEYYQMKGQDNVDALRNRLAQNALEDSDRPLLGLLGLARLSLEQVADPQRTQALFSRLEAAENTLTQRVLTYWSQNRHLRMTFDIRPAQPGDPQGMTSGMNIWGRVRDTKHMVTTGLGTRSRGFVWFFSFLAWYSQLRGEDKNLLLLLDEPGLSLHARAQEDLLRYFEQELQPHHQLIYTTHSPFMVDPQRFGRIRIVQDLSLESDIDDLPEDQQGTKVTTEILEATSDSLFPLQGALGYEIYQTLFIGPNSLVVEGVSDLLYIQTISALLQERGKAGLSEDWTITPVGGSDKVPTFVALIGARTTLNVAVLIDYQKKDQQLVENLYKKKLLDQSHVVTYADFVSGSEADVEDMFEPDFYLKLVNREYGSSIGVGDISGGHPRILRRLEQYLESNPLPNNAHFNHYRPARHFSEKIGSLVSDLSESELERFQKAFDKLNGLL